MLQKAHCEIVFMDQATDTVFGPPVGRFETVAEDVAVDIIAIVVGGKEKTNPLFLIAWMCSQIALV